MLNPICLALKAKKCGPVRPGVRRRVRKGRRAAIVATNAIGGRVLEVGVGTGISLPLYAPHLRIFGTDISEAMLRKAKARVADLRLKNVEGLAVMMTRSWNSPTVPSTW